MITIKTIPTDRASLTIIQNYMEARRDQTLTQLNKERAFAASTPKNETNTRDHSARIAHLDALNREVFNLDVAIRHAD